MEFGGLMEFSGILVGSWNSVEFRGICLADGI